jgi:hypothetical protein
VGRVGKKAANRENVAVGELKHVLFSMDINVFNLNVGNMSASDIMRFITYVLDKYALHGGILFISLEELAKNMQSVISKKLAEYNTHGSAIFKFAKSVVNDFCVAQIIYTKGAELLEERNENGKLNKGVITHNIFSTKNTIITRVRLSGMPFTFVSTHLPMSNTKPGLGLDMRVKAINEVWKRITAYDNVVFTGDLNFRSYPCGDDGVCHTKKRMQELILSNQAPDQLEDMELPTGLRVAKQSYFTCKVDEKRAKHQDAFDNKKFARCDRTKIANQDEDEMNRCFVWPKDFDNFKKVKGVFKSSIVPRAPQDLASISGDKFDKYPSKCDRVIYGTYESDSNGVWKESEISDDALLQLTADTDHMPIGVYLRIEPDSRVEPVFDAAHLSKSKEDSLDANPSSKSLGDINLEFDGEPDTVDDVKVKIDSAASHRSRGKSASQNSATHNSFSDVYANPLYRYAKDNNMPTALSVRGGGRAKDADALVWSKWMAAVKKHAICVADVHSLRPRQKLTLFWIPQNPSIQPPTTKVRPERFFRDHRVVFTQGRDELRGTMQVGEDEIADFAFHFKKDKGSTWSSTPPGRITAKTKLGWKGSLVPWSVLKTMPTVLPATVRSTPCTSRCDSRGATSRGPGGRPPAKKRTR